MSVLDWVVCVGLLAATLVFSLRRSGGKSLESYFAGHRAIPWWASGLSVMATQVSAITVIGLTGQGHEGGLEFVQTYFGLPFAMVLLCIFFVPLYRSQPILTAYEYLERRFGPATRTLTAIVFLLSRALAQGISFGAPAVVLAAITGLDPVATILISGALCVVFTLFGGVTAVIWVDVQQMLVIFVGLFLVLAILLLKLAPSFAPMQMLDLLGAAGKLNGCELAPESWSLLPRAKGASTGAPSFWEDRYNLWSGLLGGLFMHLAFFGCDQSQVQRLLTNSNSDESRKTLLVSAVVKLPMQIVVMTIGVLMWLFYASEGTPLLFNPADVARAESPEMREVLAPLEARHARAIAEQKELAREIAREKTDARLARWHALAGEVSAVRTQARKALHGKDEKDTNFIFTGFILANLPPVALGIVIAAIFAATLAGSVAILNSLAASAVVDLYRRRLRKNASDAQSVRMGKILTAVIGMLATIAAVYTYDRGSLIEVINIAGSFFYGAMLGIFALALLWPKAGPRAGVCGVLAGIASVAIVHFTWEVAFLWYNVVGCVGVLVVGIAVSFFERRSATPRTDAPRASDASP